MKPRTTALTKETTRLILRDALKELKEESQLNTFLNTFLTPSERIIVGNRLFIAAMLVRGYDYAEISEELGVGMSTITSVKEKLYKNPKKTRKLVRKLGTPFQKRLEIIEGKKEPAHISSWEYFIKNFFSYKS